MVHCRQAIPAGHSRPFVTRAWPEGDGKKPHPHFLSLLLNQLLGRASDLPLPAEPARKGSPHECIARKPEDEEGNDQEEDRKGECHKKEDDAGKGRHDKQEKVRYNVLPCHRYKGEPFRVPLPEEEAGKPAPPERTRLPEIITVHAVRGKEPQLEGEGERKVDDGPEDAKSGHE